MKFLVSSFFSINKKQLQKITSEKNNLFNLVERINLSGNQFFNYAGLNTYMSKNIDPWLKMNKGISQIKYANNSKKSD